MKKVFSAIAVLAATTVATLGITVGSASADNATLSYDCFTVTAHYTDFSTGANTATITINGVAHDVSFTGKNGSATVPFVSHSGDPDVAVSTTFTSGNGQPKTISDPASRPTAARGASDDRAAHGPTTVPINVDPEVVVRPSCRGTGRGTGRGTVGRQPRLHRLTPAAPLRNEARVPRARPAALSRPLPSPETGAFPDHVFDRAQRRWKTPVPTPRTTFDHAVRVLYVRKRGLISTGV